MITLGSGRAKPGESQLITRVPGIMAYRSMREAVRIVSIIIYHLSKVREAMFFTLCEAIFLVRLQEKFGIDHVPGIMAYRDFMCSLLMPASVPARSTKRSTNLDTSSAIVSSHSSCRLSYAPISVTQLSTSAILPATTNTSARVTRRDYTVS